MDFGSRVKLHILDFGFQLSVFSKASLQNNHHEEKITKLATVTFDMEAQKYLAEAHL